MTGREKEVLDKTIEILKDNFDPRRIILFGSRAKGKSKISSDFDLAIDMKRPDIRLRRNVEDEIDNAIGLYSVDLIYLNSVEKDFKELVLKTGKVVYER